MFRRTARLLRSATQSTVDLLEPRRLLAAADLDLTFGEAGVVRNPVPNLFDEIPLKNLRIALDRSGRSVVAGEFDEPPDNLAFGRDIVIRRRTADGQLDSTFGDRGVVTLDRAPFDELASITISGDRILLATTIRGSRGSSIELIQLRADGSLDPGFDQDGIRSITFSSVTGARALGAEYDQEGRIVLAGQVLPRRRSQSQAVGRLNPDGSLDTTFSQDGLTELRLGANEALLRGSVLFSPEQHFYLAGAMQAPSPGGGSRFILAAARFGPDGLLDESFGDAGVYRSPESVDGLYDWANLADIFAAPAAVSDTGELLLSGSVGSDGTGDRLGRIEYLDTLGRPNGPSSITFRIPADTIVSALNSTPRGVVVQTSGAENALRRFDQAGEPDQTFGSNGFQTIAPPAGADFTAYDLARGPQGQLVAAGTARYRFNSIKLAGVTVHSFDADGGPLRSFGTDGIAAPPIAGVLAQFDALIELPGRKLLAAGFTPGSNGSDVLLRCYNPDGSLDSSFGVHGDRVIDFGGADRAFALALQPDGKILVGGTTVVETGANLALARLSADGALDRTFDRDGRVVTQAGAANRERIIGIHVQADGRILVGGPSDRRSALLRYNVDGSIDRSFGTGGMTIVKPLPTDSGLPMIGFGVRPDGSISVAAARISPGAGFSFPESIVSLLRFDRNGKPDNSFGVAGRRDTSFNFDYFVDEPTFPFELLADGTEFLAAAEPTFWWASRTTVKTRGGVVATLAMDQDRGGRAYDITDIAVTPAGRVVLFGGGAGTGRFPTVNPAIAVLNPNGTNDVNFADGGFVAYPVESSFTATRVLAMSDGRIVAAGTAGGVPVLIRVLGDADPRPSVATLISGRLEVRGTRFSDDISVRRVGQEVVLRVNLDEARFPFGDVQAIRVDAGAGNDMVSLDGLTQPASLFGQSGDDTLRRVGAGTTVLEGGPGNDFLAAGDDASTLIGAAGRDTLFSGLAADDLSGGRDIDLLDYSARNRALNVTNDNVADDGASGERDNVQSNIEQVFAGAGNDRVTLVSPSETVIAGGAGNDTLRLGDGGGQLRGDAGNDLLTGGASGDDLLGGPGDDTLRGGGGDDSLAGFAGRDDLSGGEGQDRHSYPGVAVNMLIALNNVADDGGPGERDNIRDDIEIVSGGDGDDLIHGSDGNEFLDGGGGSDTLIGLGGNDYLYDVQGNNSLLGGEGEDTLIAGQGNDTLRGGAGADNLSGGGGFSGQYPVSAFTGIRNRGGNDLLLGDAGDDFFDEFDYNNDTIDGGAGVDTARRDLNNHRLRDRNDRADDTLISVEKFIGISRFPES